MIQLRPPAYPLITVDPYFSVWSMNDKLNEEDTKHWTGKPNTLLGTVKVDGKEYGFLGNSKNNNVEPLQQISVELDAFSTKYIFEGVGIRLTAKFTSPLIPDDLELLSRPVSYLKISVSSLDGKERSVEVSVSASEELCTNCRSWMPVKTEKIQNGDINIISVGTLEQPILGKSGDDIRIDWGYFYLCAKDAEVSETLVEEMMMVKAKCTLNTTSKNETLFAFAYDDIYSIVYFGKACKAYWKRDNKTIETAVKEAFYDYESIVKRCNEFSTKLYEDALEAGGSKYSDLLLLSLRQVLAAHKLVLSPENELLYISKECFSNGCAATVDVSYPSMPLFLLYNPQLVYAMLRPIFKYAKSDIWIHDFAPHDCGVYPILNGQAYSKGTILKNQMPIEECGNVLLMAASYTLAANDFSLINSHKDLLDKWADYLVKQGVDPKNQLCTDDFTGHLAHNCNLSLKSILALAAYSKVCREVDKSEKMFNYGKVASEMAVEWVKLADDGQGSYRLAFDQPGTYSMKYNMIWDLIFQLNLFPKEVRESEFASYKKHVNPYGLPLDCRADYTKSDWLVWTACLSSTKEEFCEMIEPLWTAYNKTRSRVPMPDWYCTISADKIMFQNRTVQGGLFMKLLLDKGLTFFSGQK